MRFIHCLFVAILTAGMTWAAEPVKKPIPSMRPALLVIDVQKAYLPMMDDQGKENALELINAVMDLFRERGFPVIRVYATDPDWGPPPGTPDFEFPDTLKVKPDDPKVVKTRASSFKGTDLEKMLKADGINTLFLTGLSATGCVLATYMEAEDLGYDTFMVRRAVMSPDARHTTAVQEFTNTIPYAAVKVMLDGAARN